MPSSVGRTQRGRARTLYLVGGAVTFVAVSLVLTAWRAQPAPAAGHGLLAAQQLTSHRSVDWVSIAGAASSLPTAVSLAARDCLRTRSLIPVVLVLSTPLIAFPATALDVLGGAAMLEGPYLAAPHILGRQVSTFAFAAWSGFGIFVYLAYAALIRGARARVLWWLLAGGCAVEVVSEECQLQRGAYIYYGNQPLVLIHSLPWWWVPCNIVGCFLATTLAYRYRSGLARWRVLVLALTTPLSMLVVYAVAAPPALVAVNHTYPWLLTQALGLASIALAITVAAGILRLVAHRTLDDRDTVPRRRPAAHDAANPRRSDPPPG